MLAAMTAEANPDAVTREKAIAVLTSWPAYAEFAEGEKGVLAPGKLADLAVLSQDVTTAPAAALPATMSLMTIAGGRVAYAAPEFMAAP